MKDIIFYLHAPPHHEWWSSSRPETWIVFFIFDITYLRITFCACCWAMVGLYRSYPEGQEIDKQTPRSANVKRWNASYAQDRT